MSVPELRERIEKLSSEIGLVKKLLKMLRHDKCLVQRQLNAVLDPVARLPLELSSEIFLQSLAPFPEPGAGHAPMLLLNICNAWTNIVLSTPALWAAIHVVFPCAKGLKKSYQYGLNVRIIAPCPYRLKGDSTRPLFPSFGGTGSS